MIILENNIHSIQKLSPLVLAVNVNDFLRQTNARLFAVHGVSFRQETS